MPPSLLVVVKSPRQLELFFFPVHPAYLPNRHRAMGHIQFILTSYVHCGNIQRLTNHAANSRVRIWALETRRVVIRESSSIHVSADVTYRRDNVESTGFLICAPVPGSQARSIRLFPVLRHYPAQTSCLFPANCHRYGLVVSSASASASQCVAVIQWVLLLHARPPSTRIALLFAAGSSSVK